MLVACLEDCAAAERAETAQKGIWGAGWRSVYASALSWGFALLRECLYYRAAPATVDEICSEPLAQSIARAILCAAEPQDRVTIGVSSIRLVKRLMKAKKGGQFLSSLLAALLRCVGTEAVFTAWGASEHFFRLLKGIALVSMEAAASSPEKAAAAGLPDAWLPLFVALRAHPILELSEEDEDPVLQGLLSCFGAVAGSSYFAVRYHDCAHIGVCGCCVPCGFACLRCSDASLVEECVSLAEYVFQSGLFAVPTPEDLFAPGTRSGPHCSVHASADPSRFS